MTILVSVPSYADEAEIGETGYYETEISETEMSEGTSFETEIFETEPIETQIIETEAFEAETFETVNGETETAEIEVIETECEETEPSETECTEEVNLLTDPGQVTGLYAKSWTSGVALYWEAPETTEYFLIYRSVNGGTKDYLDRVEGSERFYKDATAYTDLYTRYWVYPYVNDVKGTCEASVKCHKKVEVGVVKGFKAESKTTGVHLTWDEDPDASAYKIYRKRNSSDSWTLIKTLKVDDDTVCHYIDTEASTLKYNYYNIKIVAGLTKGHMTNRVKGSKLVSLSSVTGLQTTPKNNGIVSLSWNKVANATGYKVYVRRSGDSKQKLLKTLTSGNALSYTDRSAYYYNDNIYYVVPTRHISKGQAVTIKARALTAGKREVQHMLKSVSGTNTIAAHLEYYKQNNPAHMYAMTKIGRPVYESSCGQSAFLAALYALKAKDVSYMPFLNQSADAGFYSNDAYWYSDYENLKTKGTAVQKWVQSTYGISCKQIQSTWDLVVSEVSAGHPVIYIEKSPNHFQATRTTGNGHYVVILAYCDNKIFIWNPNNTPGGQGWFTKTQFEQWLVPRAGRKPYALSES